MRFLRMGTLSYLVLAYYSIEQNKGNRDLYTMDLNGENLKQITKSPKSEFNAVWRPDGKKIRVFNL